MSHSKETKRGNSYWFDKLHGHAKKYINTCVLCGKQGYSPVIEASGFDPILFRELTSIMNRMEPDSLGRCPECAAIQEKHDSENRREMSHEMKTYTIDGNHFSSLEEFYDEMERIFTSGLSWRTGHNWGAFNDILRGGFGMHDYREPIRIQWIHYSRSKKVLDSQTLLTILEIILDCDNSHHDCKLELYD